MTSIALVVGVNTCIVILVITQKWKFNINILIMKQTVEEAAKEARMASAETLTTYGTHTSLDDFTYLSHDEIAEAAFIKGADWQAKQSPWISVEDKAGCDTSGDCIVMVMNGDIFKAYFSSENKWMKSNGGYYDEVIDDVVAKYITIMSKGIYTKENVGNGVFIFTVNKNFVEPKFWGLHEENEQAQCVVIIHDGNALFFYPEDMDNDTHILLDWEKEQTGKIYPTTEEGMKDTDGIGNTKALAASGSEIAEKVIALDLCGLSWRIPTLQESVLGYEHKVMLNAALAICGKQPVKDDWYWCSTRKGNKRNFILSWGDGFRYDNIQDSDDWVRPVSAASLNSL